MELVIIEVYGHNNFFCQYTLFIELLEIYTKITKHLKVDIVNGMIK